MFQQKTTTRGVQFERQTRSNMNGFSNLVDAVGTPRFASEMLFVLSQLCDVDHIHLFSLDQNGKPTNFASLSLDGSAMADHQTSEYVGSGLWRDASWMFDGARYSSASASTYHVTASNMRCSALGNLFQSVDVGEKVLVSSPDAHGSLGFSFVRSPKRRLLTSEEWERLYFANDVLFPIYRKNMDLCRQQGHVLTSLSSLGSIEHLLSGSRQKLPLRESQVAARLLFSISPEGIAHDLGISLETVKTYRKRIYRRLSISTHKELLIWYMRIFAHC